MTGSSKRCCTCHEERPLSQFNRRRAAQDGLQSRCRDCSRLWYQLNRADHVASARRRNDRVRIELRAFLAAYFAEHPCVDCGERDVRCLEFDHRDPTRKSALVGRLVDSAMPWATVLAEIEKCDVRCANCHRRVTAERGRHWRQAVHEAERSRQAGLSLTRLESVFGGPPH